MIQLISQTSAPAATYQAMGWRNFVGHTHTYRIGDDPTMLQPPENYRMMAQWAAEQGVDAVGLGSPHTPKSGDTYLHYENVERELYYSGRFDQKSVRDLDELRSMLEQVNAAANGRTLFYLDNETPKGRYGHLWWVGYECDFPAWHDYDQPYDRWLGEEQPPGYDGPEPMPYARRPYMEIVASQRAAGALGYWAHPTSWWTTPAGQFFPNIASEMPAHVIADGFLDGMVIMGYEPYRPQYLDVWTKLLDLGYRVPGVAEQDGNLSSRDLPTRPALVSCLFLGIGRPVSVEAMKAPLRVGRIVASSGPFVELTVDAMLMGEVTRTAKDRRHKIVLTVLPAPGQKKLGLVELVGPGGTVLWAGQDVRPGVLKLSMQGFSRRGYIYARAFGEGEFSGRSSYRDVRYCAVSNPVYLHPKKQDFTPPAQTRTLVRVAADSKFSGGTIYFETAGGDFLESGTAGGEVEVTMPASGRIRMVSPDGEPRTDYLINANPKVLALQRYLYRGQFRRDFPSAKPGDVPVKAWQMEKFQEAMREVELSY